ncbi:HPt (histidine-containing phosphotransfer) domain-containing protein [Meinhardsimonia xiamenensis]|jgi:HPt (histidine-containing phosphotransfer) domain-containing protein|uniref:HPt (Histidine-containing phosphotransfer) domain-containing protein n=1 Tax=Meinhardsimonia xiamenensis TaxID=990712 RepID=A0A1G8Y926_9RHOB|nr:Hpt domain-containing protein [Meinhardsimonia xiamenensis]PRX37188.1 HPt (histidine-containing phosphotransfer) domain-containing protein [Meinhardsimonia xiamenensis]SDJ98540.1 HPt (histidine-containing phosphotransfer) domain-containing protein [Meinhardsimonia xiamenensis]
MARKEEISPKNPSIIARRATIPPCMLKAAERIWSQPALAVGVPLVERAVIDWKRVEELKDEVGPEDFGDVLEVFLAEMDEMMNRFARAPQTPVTAEELHFLKGSALNLGFAALGALCTELEPACRSGEPVSTARLTTCYQRSRACFLANLDSGPAAA